MRGGAPADDAIRGITARDVAIWTLYRSLARGDFHHDFGERTESRDLIVEGDRERFLNFAKNLTTKGMVWLEAQFTNKLKGKTLYELLGGSFDILVPRGFSSTDASFPNEDSLIERITQTPYSTIKQRAVAAQYPEDPYTLDFTVEGVKRSYTVRSSSYREGERPKSLPKSGPAWEKYKRNRNISTMFKEVTGGKTKFALIVDATGGLALTDILNASLEPQPGVPCQFYIIQNIENSSDSADKVQNMTVKPGPVGSPTASIFYLRDIGDTVVYPLWTTTETDQKSNIFASMQISLTRMKDGTVEADLLVNGGQSFHIGDVANASNVKNASLAAAAIMVEKGIVPEVFVYTLIKRMGDWCQALSMLDLDRAYSVTNKEGRVAMDASRNVMTTTLRSMLVDTEIGVVTNDRILFAFCLFHGLNVFLTSAMDIARLIYFKNKNDLPAGPDLIMRADAIFNEASTQFAALRGTFNSMASQLNSLLRDRAQQITTTTSLPEYLALVKEFTVIFSRLDTNILSEFDAQPEKAELDKFSQQYAVARQASDGIPMFSIAGQMSALGSKIQTRLTVGNQALERLQKGQYPGKSVIDVRVAALASKLAQGGRAPNSVAIVEARDTLVRVREDVEMIVKNVPALVQILRDIFSRGFAPTLREETNYGEVLKGLNPTRLVLGLPPYGTPPAGGGQRGGGLNIAIAYTALRTRMIRLLPPEYQEQTSTTNTYVQGDDYVDDKMRAYTVVDEYIVTKEDTETFDVFFADDGSQPIDPAQVEYICKRYMLLQFDMLTQNYEQFKDTFSADDIPKGWDDHGLVALDEDGAILPGTQLDDNLRTLTKTLQSIDFVMRNFTPTSVAAYRNGTRVDIAAAMTAETIATELGKLKASFIGLFPSPVFNPIADNDQKIFRFSEYYANLVLTLIDRELRNSKPVQVGILTVENGVSQLTPEGAALYQQMVAYLRTNDESVPITSSIMSQQILTAAMSWITSTRPGANAANIQLVLTRQLQTAQANVAMLGLPSGGGHRKTHRRRLPKLV
jgi:hypothetical protein